MFFEDLIQEARVVCEVVSPAKKKKRMGKHMRQAYVDTHAERPGMLPGTYSPNKHETGKEYDRMSDADKASWKKTARAINKHRKDEYDPSDKRYRMGAISRLRDATLHATTGKPYFTRAQAKRYRGWEPTKSKLPK